MKRLLITLAITAAFASGSYAQSSLFGLHYNMSLPIGDTKDYIQEFSFRGASFEGRGFVSDQVSIGGWASWEVFKERLDNATFNGNGVDVTGTQVRYLNMLPLLVTSHYYLGDFSTPTAYFGAGVGAYRSLQRTEVGLVAISNDNWHFGFAPEIGVWIPLDFSTGLNIATKFHYATKSNDSQYTYVSFIIGLSWMDF